MRCVVGYLPLELNVRFKQPPLVEVIGRRFWQRAETVEFGHADEQIVLPISFETDVKDLLDRREFSRLCDTCGSADAVLRALQQKRH